MASPEKEEYLNTARHCAAPGLFLLVMGQTPARDESRGGVRQERTVPRTLPLEFMQWVAASFK